MRISDIPAIYINLTKRPDRNEHIRNELTKLGIHSPTRCNAIETDNGAIGCSLSHIKCLTMAIEADYEYVLICEDDLEIVDTKACIRNINKFLNDSSIVWDVALIAGNNMNPYTYINKHCIRVSHCFAATGYIVRKSYYQTILQHYKEGVTKLMREPDNHAYRLDVYWMILQRAHNWMMVIPPTIVQKENYSNIENRVTNYHWLMLNYDKSLRPQG